jgi:predicted NBD/HSP70 family sugar kinase
MSELFASVDLGGTKIAAAITGAGGEIIVEGRIATNSHDVPDGVLSRIAALVADLSASAGCRPVALGMGVPGLVDVAQGITRFLPISPRNGAASRLARR